MAPFRISVLDAAPTDSEFVALAEHQSSTPASFALDENPILYHKSDNAVLTSTAPLPGLDNTTDIKTDAFVSSCELLLWFPELGKGLTVPYQCVTLHAIQRQPDSLYLQLQPDTGDDEADMMELTIIPAVKATAQQFYEALSECSGLHPDPDDDDDEPMNGEIGEPSLGPWITAESLQQGEADDFDIDENEEDDENMAGVEVEVEDQSVQVGVRRARADNDSEPEEEEETGEEDAKWRRTN